MVVVMDNFHMLRETFIRDPEAYNKIFDELYKKGVTQPDIYSEYHMYSDLTPSERGDKVRRFLREFLNNRNNRTTERFMEFYFALKKYGFHWEFRQLASHELFEETAKLTIQVS